jgi:hypothetical protein
MFAKFLCIIIALMLLPVAPEDEGPIIDSSMTLEEAIAGTGAPAEIIDSLEIIYVDYYSFDSKLHRGQLVVNRAVKEDIEEIFELIKETRFPVEKVIPIVEYDWSDNASMEDNNTSAFNYRFVAGTQRLSNHASGRAIDINPFQNPAVYNSGRVSPDGAEYDPDAPGTLTRSHPITRAFIERGWRWGGNWNSLKDYQHFDKP